MQINGESIYGTRPWVIYGEGPSTEKKNAIKAQGFNEGNVKLSRGMMIFIVVGLALLIAIGVTYNMIHAEDPEYVRTQIDPDSNLMEKNGPTFDTVAIDVQKRDSIKKAENLEAEKLLNSIRKKKQETNPPPYNLWHHFS